MKGYAEYKVPEGKLVKVKVEIHNNNLVAVQILGDFFVHPEHHIEEIEKHLCGLSANNRAEEFEKRVREIVKKTKTKLVGVDAGSIAIAVKEAIRNAHEAGG